jgi:acyl-CoA thioester hydrolase
MKPIETSLRKAMFQHIVRVYYEESDRAGIVYYANHLGYFRRARTVWLRSLGVECTSLLSEQGSLYQSSIKQTYAPTRAVKSDRAIAQDELGTPY